MRINGRRVGLLTSVVWSQLTAASAGVLVLLLADGTVRGGQADVFISEFMASNSGKQAKSLHDELGNSPDWIELCNGSATDVSLDGWSLTDDATQLAKWRFPPTLLPAHSYLVVFASGRDTNVAGQATVD